MNKSFNIIAISLFVFTIVTLAFWLDWDVKKTSSHAFVPLDSQVKTIPLRLDTYIVDNASDFGSRDESIVDLGWQQIAIEHKQRLLYPSYSQPISDESSLYIKTNMFIETQSPVLDGTSTAMLSVEKYRNFYRDVVLVTLKTQEKIISTSLDVVSVEDQKILNTIVSDSLKWEIKPDENWPEDIRFVARIQFERGEDVVSADIRLYHSVANVIDIAEAQAKGHDMIIPITLKIEKDGIYRVRANLYQRDGKAIASLVEKQQLLKGTQMITLRAFKKVLPKYSVDLELRNVVIELMPRTPKDKTSYGESSFERYEIGSFDSNSLTNEEYQLSEQEQQQISFLESIGRH